MLLGYGSEVSQRQVELEAWLGQSFYDPLGIYEGDTGFLAKPGQPNKPVFVPTDPEELDKPEEEEEDDKIEWAEVF